MRIIEDKFNDVKHFAMVCPHCASTFEYFETDVAYDVDGRYLSCPCCHRFIPDVPTATPQFPRNFTFYDEGYIEADVQRRIDRTAQSDNKIDYNIEDGSLVLKVEDDNAIKYVFAPAIYVWEENKNENDT